MTRWRGDDSGDELVEVTHDELIRETAKAILVKVNGEDEWIPKSQCEEWDEKTVILKRWLADDRGFDYPA